MVNKILVNPNEVRGAGDIVSPKSLTDFLSFDTVITESSEDVLGREMTVYTGTYQSGSYFDSLSMPRFIQYNESVTSFTVSAVLKYRNGGSLITGAEVSLYVNSDTVLTGTTGSDGKVTFTVPLDATDGLYQCRMVFSGNSNVGGGFLAFKTVVGTVKECNLYGKNDVIMQTGDTVSYVGEVLAEDFEGNSVPVNGQTVNLLAYNPELFKYIGAGELVYDGTSTPPTSVSGNFYAGLGNIAQTMTLRFTAANNNCIIILTYVASSFNLMVNLDGSLVINTELNGRGFKLIDGVLYYNDTLYNLGFTDEFTISSTGSAWTLYSFPTETDAFGYNHSALTVSTGIDGTTVANSSGSQRIYWANVTGTSTSDTEADFFGDTVTSFDLVNVTGTITFMLRTSTLTNIQIYAKRLTVLGSVKFEYIDGVMTYSVDDEVLETVEVPNEHNYMISVYVGNNGSFTFKNFVIGGF